MSGALGVRGGFDSHAFPPSLLLLATVLLPVALIGLPASADAPPGSPQGAPAAPLDSLRAPPVPDTAAVHIVEFGHTRTVTPTPAATLRFGEPRYVMMRSLLVPGWGQLYNRSWIKATLMAGIEGWLITGLVRDERQLTRLSREADDAQAVHDENAFNAAISAYNERLAQSINRRWLLGGAIAYALVDAYVDAHFRNFDVEFAPDPRLPPELAPAEKKKGRSKGKSGGGGVGGTMSLRWAF